MSRPERILFITASRIGDAVLTTGVLNALLARYPGAEVTVACGAPAAKLFAGVPGIIRVHPMIKRPYGGHWRDLWRMAVPTRWTHIVDLRHSLTSYVLRTRHRNIFTGGDPALHKVEQFSAVLKDGQIHPPHLWLRPHDTADAAALLPDNQPVLAVGATANWRGKQWPVENFLKMIQHLTSDTGCFNDASIALVAAPDEREQVQPLFDALPASRVIDLIGKGDLLTTAACLQRATLYIGNDSGLMHMAAAMGTPTLGLFGPSNDTWYRPWGAHTAFVRTPESMAELTSHPEYDHRTTGSLMYSLPVETVVEAAETLYKRYHA